MFGSDRNRPPFDIEITIPLPGVRPFGERDDITIARLVGGFLDGGEIARTLGVDVVSLSFWIEEGVFLFVECRR